MKTEQIGLAWSIRSKWTLITRSKQVRRGFTFFLIQLLVLLLIHPPLTLDRASRLKITRKVFSAPFQGGRYELYSINYMTCVILKFPSKMSTCLLLSAKNDSSILVVCHEVQSVNAVCLNVRTHCSRLLAVAIHQPSTTNNNAIDKSSLFFLAHQYLSELPTYSQQIFNSVHNICHILYCLFKMDSLLTYSLTSFDYTGLAICFHICYICCFEAYWYVVIIQSCVNWTADPVIWFRRGTLVLFSVDLRGARWWIVIDVGQCCFDILQLRFQMEFSFLLARDM